MARRTTEIISINGNSAIGRVSSILPPGFDYIGLNWLASTATAVISDISELKESLNTDITRLYNGPQQEMMNLVDKMQAMSFANLLRMPFEQIGMKDVKPTYTTTRNTLSADPETGLSIANYRVEMVCGVAEDWRLFAEVDDATSGGPGAVSRILQFTESAPGGNWFSFQNKIPFGLPQRRFFRRGFFTLDAGDFLAGDFMILRGMENAELFRRPYAVNVGIASDYVREPNPATYGGTDFYLLDTTETGIPENFDTMIAVPDGTAGAFKMGGQSVMPQALFDLRPFPSAPCGITAVVETVGRL